MELTDLLEALNAGTSISAGSPLHEVMHRASQEALRITVQLNSSYHEPARIIELMSELTGQQVDETFRLFPPFHTDFGKNITFGRRVFVNSCCRFQDQGGIRIGDDVLIGHSAMLATLNHDVDPDRRGDMHPSPIVIGHQVWLGANVTVLPGVTIGDGAIIGAGSIVTSDIPAGAIAVGSPARVVRLVDRATGER